ncbi:hypothetical protein GCM10027615_20400 [Plantactinospora veratri]
MLVLMWPALPEAAQLPDDISLEVAGLALEHRLQGWLRPLANCEHRTRRGGWRNVSFETSKSQGARAAPRIDQLFGAVQKVWESAASSDADEMRHPAIRSVNPGTFLPTILGAVG